MSRTNSGDVAFIHQAEQLDENYPRIAPALASSKQLDHRSFKARLEAMKEAQMAAEKAHAQLREAVAIKKAARKELGAMMKRVRAGVVSHFGGDAPEVVLVGLTPASARKRPARKPPKVA